MSAVRATDKSHLHWIIALLTLFALAGVTFKYRGDIAQRESFVQKTLATMEQGTVPLEKGQYDLARLSLAATRDHYDEAALYRRMWTYHALIIATGLLLLLALDPRRKAVVV